MWILTPSITSAFAAATGVSISASSEQLASACAQSLLWRSSASPSATWQRRLKQNSWTTHLSGAICEPSLGESFTDWWTSSLAATRASHSQPPANVSAPKTQDTSGRTYQPELLQCDQVSVSLKTSRDISALGFPTCCKTWQEWVTERRGAWRQRVNAARLTSGKGSSSWPTTAARDYKGTFPNYSTRKDGKSRADQLAVAVDLEERTTWPTPTVQEAGKIGNQANHGQLALSNHPAIRGEVSRDKYEKSKHGPAAPASSNMSGSRQGLSWATPRATEAKLGRRYTPGMSGKDLTKDVMQWGTPAANDANKQNVMCEVNSKQAGLPKSVGLELQRQWGTPTARDHKSGRGNEDRQYKELTPMVERQQSGKLNPRWVETLMGLPIGWTMPSCTSPQTIAPMSCDSSAMESCLPPQSEPSEFSLAS